MATKRTKLNKVIGITEGNEIVCVDGYFKHTGDVKMEGYTGTTYIPVACDQVREYQTLKYTKEYLADSIPEEDIIETYGSLTKMARVYLDNMDGEYVGHDNSHLCDYGDQLEELVTKKLVGFKPKTFDCIGGGRLFGNDSSYNKDTTWEVLFEPELFAEICKLECK